MRYFAGFKIGLFVAIAVTLSGCGPHYVVPPDAHFATDFDKSQPPIAPAIPNGAQSHSIMLKTFGVSTIPKNAIIGGSGTGPNCKLSGIIRTSGTDAPQAPVIVWRRAFYRVLKDANYNVVDNPDDSFEDKTQLRPEYLLALKILDEKRNDCYPGNIIGLNLPRVSEIEDKILWEVYDVAQQKVVLTVPTTGYSKGDLDSDPLQGAAFYKMIENNVKMLAANQQFRDLLVSRR